MRFVKFEEQNYELGAGDNPDTIPLPICRGVYHSSEGPVNMFFSKLHIPPDQIEKIIENGGHIYVGIMGLTQPPMIFFADKPWEVQGYPFERDRMVVKNSPDQQN